MYERPPSAILRSAMKYRVVACGVFEPYIAQLAGECGAEVDVRALDAGLHSRPNDLRLMLQSEIDEASSRGDCDAVVLLYGLCGRGTAGLEARDVPVVIPRAHDCITLFLGSSEAYLRQFAAHPGTFYHTLGWIEKKLNPRNREASELYADFEKAGYELHPDFHQLDRKYGGENAMHIVSFLESWKRNYTRAAYIDLGFDGEQCCAEFTCRSAEILGWKHEVIRGDPTLLRRLMQGDWSDSRVFVLPPGARSATTGDDRIFAAAQVDSEQSGQEMFRGEVVIESGNGGGDWCGIGLGIDAGGTYTDAVVYDLGERRLLAKAKSLTTYNDLLEGIRGALAQLPAELLQQVEVTSLSTTLATNSIVEGRGHKVGLVALTPWGWTEEQIGHRPIVNVPGSVSITGEVIQPLDEQAARSAVRTLMEREHCAAIVIAGYAIVRNPEQANRVREIAQEMYDVPVVCAHEVSRRINGIHGAQTAIANASLLPVVRQLIDSVHRALADFRVPGKLMVVKGDGTPVDESVARARPVETILSGPAASVSGARILTRHSDALVLDIGGTTTDCAILEDGHVAVSEDGARIGSWVMSVDAVEISTAGLGGDSRIDFTRDRRITIGPVRNVPIACLADEHPRVREWLEELDSRKWRGEMDASAMDVLLLGGRVELTLTDRERQLADMLRGGPIPAALAAQRMGIPSIALLPTSRMETCGMLKRSALTPTDLLHVTGQFIRWNADAARKALAVFASMFGAPVDEVLEMALTAVTRRLFEEILRREVTWEQRNLRDLPEDWSYLLDKAFSDDGRGLGVSFTLRRPVVAIGAPASALVPPVADHVGVEVVIPEHADVANAIGAIGTEISIREEVLIRPGQFSNYVLHGSGERIEFAELERATDKAVEISRERARTRAVEAGALVPEVTVTRRDRLGTVSDGGSVFLERRVVSIASGGAFARKRSVSRS